MGLRTVSPIYGLPGNFGKSLDINGGEGSNREQYIQSSKDRSLQGLENEDLAKATAEGNELKKSSRAGHSLCAAQ